jgi:hypothetical protein
MDFELPEELAENKPPVWLTLFDELSLLPLM